MSVMVKIYKIGVLTDGLARPLKLQPPWHISPTCMKIGRHVYHLEGSELHQSEQSCANHLFYIVCQGSSV